MSGAIPWKMLQKQYQGDSVYHDDLSKLLVSPEKVGILKRFWFTSRRAKIQILLYSHVVDNIFVFLML